MEDGQIRQGRLFAIRSRNLVTSYIRRNYNSNAYYDNNLKKKRDAILRPDLLKAGIIYL